MRTLLAFLCCCLLQFSAQAQEQALPFVAGPWPQVLAQAKAQHRAVFLYAGSPSCHFCQPMETKVFPDSAVQRYYTATFVSYKVNVDEGEGAMLAKRYAITALPAYLYFSPEGKLRHLSNGYKPAAAFLQDGHDALNPHKAFVMLQERYRAGDRQPDFLYDYGTASAWSPDDPLYDEVNAAYWATQSAAARRSEKNLAYIFQLYTRFSAPTTQYFLTHSAAFVPRFGAVAVQQKLRAIVGSAARALGEQNALPALRELQQTLARTGHVSAGQWQALAQVQYLLAQPQRDWPAYLAAVQTYGQQYAAQDPYTLYEATGYALAFVEDPALLAKAAPIMQQAVAVAPSYLHLCTQAKLLHKLGQSQQALQVVQQALAVAAQEQKSNTEALSLQKQLTQHPTPQ